MKKAFWTAFFWMRSIIRSFKSFNQIHLMDYVVMNGEEYFINDGKSQPFWMLCPTKQNPDGTREATYAHQEAFRKLFWKSLNNSLFSLHRWYMEYWFVLDLRKKVG